MLRAASRRGLLLRAGWGRRCFASETPSSTSEPAPAPASGLWSAAESYEVFQRRPNGARTHGGTLGRGGVAGLAHGAVFGQQGGTMVLATVVSDRMPQSSGSDDGTPFSLEYREKAAASGRIPKTPNRREQPNSETEILAGRAVDRCLRPLFPPLYPAETQCIATEQAFDAMQPEPPVSLATNAASAALWTSDVPWLGPVGCVRIGLVDGAFVAEPNKLQLAASSLDLLYAGTEHRTLMVEVSAKEVPNTTLKAALRYAQAQLPPIIQAQRRLRDRGEPPCPTKRPASPFENSSSQDSYRAGAGHENPASAAIEVVGDSLSGQQRTANWNPLKSLFGLGDRGSNGAAAAEEQMMLPLSTPSYGSLKDEALAVAEQLDGGEARAIFENRSLPRGERAYREAQLQV